MIILELPIGINIEIFNTSLACRENYDVHNEAYKCCVWEIRDKIRNPFSEMGEGLNMENIITRKIEKNDTLK